MYFFTADQHYGHENIIKYCARPFSNVDEMDNTIIQRHNSLVKDDDTVVHVGDFAFAKKRPQQLIDTLNGKHVFIKGSHDKWLCGSVPIWETELVGHTIIVCHYAMRSWPRSHYGAWHVFGHSHGRLGGLGLSHDVGVDANDFYPVSFEKLRQILYKKAEYILDNPQGKLVDCYRAALNRFVEEERQREAEENESG